MLACRRACSHGRDRLHNEQIEQHDKLPAFMQEHTTRIAHTQTQSTPNTYRPQCSAFTPARSKMAARSLMSTLWGWAASWPRWFARKQATKHLQSAQHAGRCECWCSSSYADTSQHNANSRHKRLGRHHRQHLGHLLGNAVHMHRHAADLSMRQLWPHYSCACVTHKTSHSRAPVHRAP